MQDQMNQLQQLYQDYIDQCRILAAREPIGARLLQSSADSRSHPCHQAFYDAVEQLLLGLLEQGVTAREPMIRWILEAPYFCAGEDARWYLLAVQKHAALLIPGLDAPTKRRIGRWFGKLVPKHHRLPVQDEIIRMLES